jgi:biotin carboxyl carrier protein
MKRYQVTVNGVSYDVMVEEISGTAAPVAAPAAAPAPAAPAAAPAAKPAAPAGAAGAVAVKSPFQGTVVKMNVKPGDSVTKGATVCVIEAMKMETEIPAPQDGVVATVVAAQGASVQTDEVLLTMN